MLMLVSAAPAGSGDRHDGSLAPPKPLSPRPAWDRTGRYEKAPNNTAVGDMIIASGWKRWRDEVGYPGITDPLPDRWTS
eukprot:394607-Prymnesium_polylepis.1